MNPKYKFAILLLILLLISIDSYSQDAPQNVDSSFAFIYGVSIDQAIQIYELDIFDFSDTSETNSLRGFCYKYSIAKGFIPKSAIDENFGSYNSNPEFELFTGSLGYHFTFGFDVAHIYIQFTLLSQSTIELVPTDNQNKINKTRLDGFGAILLGPSDHQSNWIASHTTVGVAFLVFDTILIRASAFNIQYPDEIVDLENEELKDQCKDQYCFQLDAVTSVDIGFKF